MSEYLERRLAAILSADAVDYARLMAEDEAATVRTITAYREEISRTVEQHGGRVVDAPGDNVLAEFPTATGALECALTVQATLAVHNAALPEERRMLFRIGVHVGEVRVEAGRLYGDGVNIAARMEPLAHPGGICVSSEAHAQTRGKLDVGYEDLGELELKNLSKKVHVYRVSGAEAVVSRDRRPLLVGAVAAATMLLGAAIWWLQVPGDSVQVRAALVADVAVDSFSSRPAIAVLPFANFSGDPEQEYFADGIAEDLITRLASWRSFPVIARNSSFVYKGRAVDLKEVSRELGARYIVEGSVRRSANQVRITAQVIDASTGRHIWAKTYDRELTDVFAVQDEISTAIAAATQQGLRRMEGERAGRREPANLNAWDLLQRARWHLARADDGDPETAEVLLRRALALDPNLAAAHASLALVGYQQFITYTSDEALLETIFSNARRAIDLDPQDAAGYLSLISAMSLTGDRAGLREAARRAVELNPSMPMALAMLGMAVATEGRHAEGIALVERALQISPIGRDAYRVLDVRSIIEALSGDFDAALATVRRMIRQHPEHPWPRFYRAAILWNLGRHDEARAAFEQARQRGPEITLEHIRQGFSFLEPEAAAALYTSPLVSLGLAAE